MLCGAFLQRPVGTLHFRFCSHVYLIVRRKTYCSPFGLSQLFLQRAAGTLHFFLHAGRRGGGLGWRKGRLHRLHHREQRSDIRAVRFLNFFRTFLPASLEHYMLAFVGRVVA